jgi:hypothetical protein
MTGIQIKGLKRATAFLKSGQITDQVQSMDRHSSQTKGFEVFDRFFFEVQSLDIQSIN